MERYDIGIDVGGTFIDVVVAGAAGARYCKVPTSAGAQAESVRRGIARAAEAMGLDLGELLRRTDRIVHGTTVATNMMLEGTGARVGMLTTAGFRDELEYRRGLKEAVYDPALPAPRPLVLRRHRLTVGERIDARAGVIEPLDENAVRARVRELRSAGCESLAIGFLFSFLDSTHERRAAAIANEEWPGVYLSVSSEVLPQVREYERFSTTAVNAYVGPGTAGYLQRLERELAEAGFGGEFLVILSNGGVIDGHFAGRRAASLLLSGPAGGVLAATELVAAPGAHRNLITIDMGGTSYDVCLIADGQPRVTSDTYVARHAVALPMFAIHTIGAGGGSIARLDAALGLHVGPASAGALPGPACYGRGGCEPTVTDANLVLGYLDPHATFGGSVTLDLEAARSAIRGRIAEPLGMELEEAAYGIVRVVNTQMTNGIRVVSVQQGHDPRDFELVAFGGNGAVHAGRQAEELDITTVLVPRMAGAFSAYGGLFADARVDHLATWVGRCDSADPAELARAFADLREKGAAVLRGGGAKPRSEGVPIGDAELRHQAWLACHYAGQTSEIWVPLQLSACEAGALAVHAEHAAHAQAPEPTSGAGATAERPNGALTIEAGALSGAAEHFHRAHERERSFAKRDEPVHVVGLKLTSLRAGKRPQLSVETQAAPGMQPALAGRRDVYFDNDLGWTVTAIYRGASLGAGATLDGPAIVEEPDSTIVVYPGWHCRLDEHGIYHLTRSGDAR
ncbi:MAG: hydantoinase/oxoprolinase family protein [Deltaproteobacteria bacterium]|nr:hydantoinase/oxoprolinase family protein [Deltaproteobacteria bacterium]